MRIHDGGRQEVKEVVQEEEQDYLTNRESGKREGDACRELSTGLGA